MEELEGQHYDSIKNISYLWDSLVAGITIKSTEEKAVIRWCCCNSRQYGRESSHLPRTAMITTWKRQKGLQCYFGGKKQQFCVEVKSLAFKPISNFCSCGNNCSPQTVQKQQFLVWSIAPQCLGECWRPRDTRSFLYILSYSVPNFIMVQIRQSYNYGNDISEIPYWSPMNAGIQSVHCRLHSPLIASK